MLYDTHCHPNLSKQKKGEDIIKNFRRENPKGFLNIIWNDIKSCEQVIKLAKKYDFVSCSVWIHPTDTIKDRNNIKEIVQKLEKYIIDDKKNIIAIWECWLDYYRINSLKKQFNLSEEKIKGIQKDFFIAQITLAKKHNLPVIIHNRESKEDILSILIKTWYKNFIFHCYSENLEYAKKLLDFSPNCKISFSWIVTFKNAKDVINTAKNIPLKNIVVETDSPYLTPEPLRWKEENEPKFTKYILDKIIEIRDEDKDTIKNQIFKNSFFI